MSGHRPFSDLMKDWSPERRAESDARQAEMMAELVSLEQLREGLGISQEELANVMDVQQPAISKLVVDGGSRLCPLRALRLMIWRPRCCRSLQREPMGSSSLAMPTLICRPILPCLSSRTLRPGWSCAASF